MTHREKVVKLMELLHEIEHVKAEIDMFRYPMGRGAPPMLEVSAEEEKAIIENFVKVFEERWTDESELDKIISFLESGAGQKFLHPPREYLQQLVTTVSSAMKDKLEQYHRQWLERRRLEALISYNPPEPTVN